MSDPGTFRTSCLSSSMSAHRGRPEVLTHPQNDVIDPKRNDRTRLLIASLARFDNAVGTLKPGILMICTTVDRPSMALGASAVGDAQCPQLLRYAIQYFRGEHHGLPKLAGGEARVGLNQDIARVLGFVVPARPV